MALVAVGIAAETPAASAATVDTDTWYVLVNRHSGKAMDDYDLAISDGARVAQWTRNDGPWQQWQFIASGDGYYRLRNQHSNKVLDVYEWSTADGASVVQWRDLDGANQQFRLVDSDGGYVRLINRNSGKAVEVYNWSTADGADVKQWTDLNGANQQWQLIPVGSADYPEPGLVTGDLETHDPSVVKRPQGGYLLASTGIDIRLKTSSDRIAWTDVGRAFPNGAPWTYPYTGGGREPWAPDLTYRNGVYYMYYSASTPGSNRSAIFLATSTTGAAGSWVHRGMVIESFESDNFNAIDPNLLIDAQGRWWLSLGSYFSGLKMVRLNPATGMRFDSNMVSIASRNNGISPDPYYGRVEAPYIVRRGSYYYLYMSFDSCCAGTSSDYRVMVGRSTSPTGPYSDKWGLALMNGGGTEILAGRGGVHGPGHQAVLADTDGDVLFYHYYPETGSGETRCFYCKLGINRIGYDAAGWPYVF